MCIDPKHPRAAALRSAGSSSGILIVDQADWQDSSQEFVDENGEVSVRQFLFLPVITR